MEKNKIAAMIRKYNIVDNFDGRIRILNHHAVNEQIRQEIVAAKPEILAYLAEQREKVRAENKRKEDNFNAIPGVQELREARRQLAEFRRAFNRAFEQGDGRYPTKPNVDEKKLSQQYPAAVFALKVEYETGRSNYELSDIAQQAYDSLREGENWETVKAKYDAEKEKFVERHIWD